MIRQGAFLGAVLMALTMGFSVEAKSPTKNNAAAKKHAAKKSTAKKISRRMQLPRLLSSRELAALNPKKRAGYLKGVRRALLQMEAMQQKMYDGTRRAEWRVQFDSLIAQLNFLDSANAAMTSGDVAGANAKPGIPSITKTGTEWTISCGTGYSYDYTIDLCTQNKLNDSNCPSGSRRGFYRVALGDWSARVDEVCIPTEVIDQVTSGTDFNRGNLLDMANPWNAPNGSGFPLKQPGNFKTRAEVVTLVENSMYDASTRETIVANAPAAAPLAPVAGLIQVTGPSSVTPPTKTQISASIVETLKKNATGTKPVIPILRSGQWACSNNEDNKHMYLADLGTCVMQGPCSGAAQGVSANFMNA